MVIGFKKQFKSKILSGQKKHTFREDPKRRWKAGNKMHMATGVRTKNYECFKEDVCVSTQVVFMTIDSLNGFEMSIDGKYINHSDFMEIALNDGFDTYKDFIDWFQPLILSNEYQCWTGVIIHWTDLRY